MKHNSTNLLTASLVVMFSASGSMALAQDSAVTPTTPVTEETMLLQAIGNKEDDQELARLLESEDYQFPSSFTDNWHLGLMIGAMNTWGSYDKEASWLDRTNYAAALNFGKYMTPVNDVRLQLFYGRGTGVRGADANWNPSYPYDQAFEQSIADFHTYNWHTVGIAGQWLPNFTNLLLGYRPGRIFTLSGIVGIGLEHTWTYSEKNLSYVSVWAEHKQAATPRNLVSLQYGLQGLLRLSNRWYLEAEVTESYLDDTYDGLISDQKWDGHLNLLVGLTYRFRSKNDRLREQGPFYDKYRQAEDLLDQKRNQLNDALANQQRTQDLVDVTKNVTYTLISFDEGKIEVPRLQQNNVYQTAEAYRQLPASRIFITNSSKRDDGQFRQRAWNISKLLNQRWQVPLEDIWVDADEAHIQQLQIPEAKNYIIFIINEE